MRRPSHLSVASESPLFESLHCPGLGAKGPLTCEWAHYIIRIICYNSRIRVGKLPRKVRTLLLLTIIRLFRRETLAEKARYLRANLSPD
jgi:hypothetical protein